ncbi:MAG: hypothetical protein ACFCVH_23245 [Alphaproteobacteria bacterium]
MAEHHRDASAGTLDAGEIRRRCGDILDWQVEAILESGADAEDLMAALAWISGQDDVMGEARRPLAGTAAQVYEILEAGEDFGDDDGTPLP